MKTFLTILMLLAKSQAFAATAQVGNYRTLGAGTNSTDPCLVIPASNPDGYFSIRAHAISAGDGYKFYKNNAVNAAGASGATGYYAPSGVTFKVACICYSSGAADYGSFVLFDGAVAITDNTTGAATLVSNDATIKWEHGLTPSVATYAHPVAATNTKYCEKSTWDVVSGRIPGIYSIDAHVSVELIGKEQ